MDLLSRESLTICAPVTAMGESGVAVIRVSGPAALEISSKLAPFLPASPESHRVYYGFIVSGPGEVQIDEVLVTYFGQGKSFTGEPTVEISCHGNPLIVQKILIALQKNGAHPAERGEFTFRAVMSGRIDLVQAEGVLSLIQSKSDSAARTALRQIGGALSSEIHAAEDDLTWVLANIEAGIDFTTEDIDVIDRAEVESRIQRVVHATRKLTESYEEGRSITEGYRIVLMGPPNAGKSSLLNRFAGAEKAIVTDIPGTTRDLIEARRQIAGVEVIFVDTAGLRSAEDQIEQLGIRAARSAGETADQIFYVIDGREGLSEEDKKNLLNIGLARATLVVNKAELLGPEELKLPDFLKGIDLKQEQVLFISAKTGAGIDGILSRVEGLLPKRFVEDAPIVIRRRQYELLSESSKKAVHALQVLQEGASLEFVALELRESLTALYELLGKRLDDQVMDRVFKEFCIGK